MKTSLKSLLKTKRAAGTLLLCLFLATSCSKDETSSSTNDVNEEDAAEIITQAVDPNNGGIVLNLELAATLSISNVNPANCGVSKDSTVTRSYTGTNRSYQHNFSWNRLLTCTGTTPSQYAHHISGTGKYTSTRLTTNDQATADLTLTGLDPASTQVTINHTYTQTGNKQSNIRFERSFTSTLVQKATNIKVDKATRQIVSGTTDVTLTGTGPNGGTFSYAATLTYLGNRKANLVFKNGAAYNIQW
jgi:hypothetical protein